MITTIETIQKKHKTGIHALLEVLNQVDQLGYSLTDEWLDYIITQTSESIFIATYNEQVLGIATCMINEIDNTQAVINIAVHPQYRNKGIGSQLHNRVIRYAKDKNIKTVEAYVKKRLSNAVKFAKTRGFNPAFYAWQMDMDLNDLGFDMTDPSSGALSFREATIKDSASYVRIINQNFGDSLDGKVLGQLLKDPSVRVYLLERKGEVVGSTTIQLRTNLSVGYIYDVAIMPEYRGQGFASYMLRRCLGVLQRDNIDVATLTVTGENKQALILYQRLGFKEVEIDIVLGATL